MEPEHTSEQRTCPESRGIKRPSRWPGRCGTGLEIGGPSPERVDSPCHHWVCRGRRWSSIQFLIEMVRHNDLDHSIVPQAMVSKPSLVYYQSVVANPYIQHVLPGLQLSLFKHPTDTNRSDDQVQIARAYGELAEAIVPRTKLPLKPECSYSYGTEALSVLFLFAHFYNWGKDQEDRRRDQSTPQAEAVHQTIGIVDTLSDINPALTLEERRQ